ncbi:UNVERIFIED_CONTAM: hypothetical protein Sradi_5824400 [Sesamum radiatum]|uniref:Uncharacterized protein n=1 Tax=Sesamum radiatum TaxID=300843 RepID=A0AAW2KPM3_SESRA
MGRNFIFPSYNTWRLEQDPRGIEAPPRAPISMSSRQCLEQPQLAGPRLASPLPARGSASSWVVGGWRDPPLSSRRCLEHWGGGETPFTTSSTPAPPLQRPPARGEHPGLEVASSSPRAGLGEVPSSSRRCLKHPQLEALFTSRHGRTH